MAVLVIAEVKGQTQEKYDSMLAEATQFFATYIHPNLPEGVVPKRTVVELHSLVLPDPAAAR